MMSLQLPTQFIHIKPTGVSVSFCNPHTFKGRCKFWQNYKLASQGIICSDTDLRVIYIFSQSSTQNHSAASNIVKPLLEFSPFSTFFPSLFYLLSDFSRKKPGKQNKHWAIGVLIDYSMINQKFQEWPSKVINFCFPLFFVFSFFRSNFLRLCILKVTQQSEKHLDKILNVDEFLKRIYSVTYSNDPVARAITVR